MNDADTPGCDLLVISPHTDDLEIGLGGTVALLARQGRSVWALDLSRGELGSNATPAERWREAAEASAVLGLAGRLQLELPDGFINARDRGQVSQVAAVLRRLRPRRVVTAPDPVRHPDHVETPGLVSRACFLARLESWVPEAGPWHLWEGGDHPGPAAARWEVETLLRVCPDHDAPSLVFDVSEVWGQKTAALECYASQFLRDGSRKATAINDPAFLRRITGRARAWGRRVGVEYGEALQTEAVPVLTDLPEQKWL